MSKHAEINMTLAVKLTTSPAPLQACKGLVSVYVYVSYTRSIFMVMESHIVVVLMQVYFDMRLRTGWLEYSTYNP